MKIYIILTALFCLSANFVSAQKSLSVDTKNSTINWTGHAEVGSYAPAGTLNFKDGQLSVSGATVKTAGLTIDMKSMQQANDHLLEHLKSADFFDVDHFPVSTIKIDRISNGVAYGQLTIKDKSLPFQCPVIIKKDGKQFTISGTAIIDRTRYNIIYNSGSFFSGLGDKAIRNTFDIDFKVIAVDK